MGTASVHPKLSLPLLLPPGRVSSHTSLPAWGSFHGMQIFINIFIMGTHGLPSPASKSVPAKTPLSTVQQVLPDASSSMWFPHSHSLLPGVSTCCSMGTSTACRWASTPPWTSMSCSPHPVSSWSAPQAADQSAPEAPPSSSFSAGLCVCRTAALTCSHSSLSWLK